MALAGRIVLWVGLLCVAAAPGIALAVDVNGTYQVTIVDTTDNCTYAGSATLSQSSSSVTGSISLTLVSGTGCPPSGSGSGSGTLVGNMISFGVAIGTFGTVNFTGTVSNDGNFISGTFRNDVEGTWSAIRAQHAPAPALGSRSTAVLALLLVGSGVYLVQRRRAR